MLRNMSWHCNLSLLWKLIFQLFPHSYICSLYGYKIANKNEERYKAFISMSGGNIEKTVGQNLKKINCASLPPYSKALGHQIKCAQFVVRMWKRVHQKDPPISKECPTDYGWKDNQTRIALLLSLVIH